MMPEGHRSRQKLQEEQTSGRVPRKPGGTTLALVGPRPRRKSRLERGAPMPASMARRPGWPRNDLIPPNQETVTTDHANGNDRPDSECENEKGRDLRSAS